MVGFIDIGLVLRINVGLVHVQLKMCTRSYIIGTRNGKPFQVAVLRVCKILMLKI